VTADHAAERTAAHASKTRPDVDQHVLAGQKLLRDVGPRLGCVCSGALSGVAVKDARSAVAALEPPRSTTPVVEEQAPIDLDLLVPATPRTPVDVVAVPPNATPAKPVLAPSSTPGSSSPLGHRVSPVRGFHPETDVRPTRTSSPVNPRPVLGALPVARDVEGRALPRAYIARRRSSPRGLQAIGLPVDDTAIDDRPVESSPSRFSRVVTPPLGAPTVSAPAPARAQEEPPAPTPIDRLMSRPLTNQSLVYLLISALAIAVLVSTIVGVIVGKLVR
jgi:hypothetical protein